jgi:hypothetical protein
MASPKLVQARDQAADRAAKIDEFGDLDRRIADFKPVLARHSDLRSEILGWYPALGPDESTTANGSRWDVQISPCDKRRLITFAGKKRLHKIWGIAEFLRRCSLALKALDDIPASEHADYTVQERTGPRHLQPLPRALPKAA